MLFNTRGGFDETDDTIHDQLLFDKTQGIAATWYRFFETVSKYRNELFYEI
jgi:hypothetical protein